MAYRCPVCDAPLPPIARYPRYVCRRCAARAVSAEGRPLEFFNSGLSGGHAARYADDKRPYASSVCFIDGQPCRADEARFGGIVIERIEEIDGAFDWSGFGDRQLLAVWCSLMAALRQRGVVRSANNPVADYTESLVASALELSLEAQSKAGYDARDAAGLRYQIKGRRLAAHNASPQLGAIRNLDADPFDLLAAVAYDADLSILHAALIPIGVVAEASRYSRHSNSHVLIFRRGLLDDPRVTDITQRLAAAQAAASPSQSRGRR
jgi:hypothetical protein